MSSGVIEYRQYRAPLEHGKVLADPAMDLLPPLVAANRRRFARYQYDFQGQSFAGLARQARKDLWRAAVDFTRQYQDANQTPAEEDDAPIILTGHQPELFHPGVWIKNFATASIAKRTNARAVHLIIDNDTITSPGIRVPSGSTQNPRLETIPFDQTAAETPFENRPVLDFALFAAFRDRVRRSIRPFVENPFISEFWPRAERAARQHNNLGRALAQARHQVETSWGRVSCELPLSHVCEQPSFRWFSVHVLSQLRRFHEIYNAALVEYRTAHGLRSHTHPAPELSVREDWVEAPFWIWSEAAPQRRPLFVRNTGHHMELTDLKQPLGTLSLHRDADGSTAVDQLADWSAKGYRLRPRALVTTMFARLFLSDLFIHGIGGAKYDQLTDVIVQRFFQFEPPTFMVLTATVKLPIPLTGVLPDDVRKWDDLLRELDFNPQRHVALNSNTRELVDEKQRLIASDGTGRDRQVRHRDILRINEQLRRHVGEQRRMALERRADCVARMKRDRLLGSREFAFCLFPEETLRSRLLDI